MSRSGASSLLVLFCLLATQAAPAPARGGELMKIGLLIPLSGDRLARSTRVQTGVLLAARLLQESIGDAAGTVTIVARDSHSTVPDSVEAAGKLVTEGVSAVIGPLSSDESMEVTSEVAVPGKILFVSPSASSPDLTELRDDDFFFRTVPSDKLQARVLAELGREQGGARTAVLYINNLYGRGLSKAYRGSAESMGQEVAVTPFIGGQTSYRAETEKALADDPQSLLVIATPEDGLKILARVAERERAVRILVPDAMKDGRILLLRNPDVLAGLTGTDQAAPETRLAEKFREFLGQTAGGAGDGFVLETSFDATILLALAALRAGALGQPVNGTSVRDSLRFVANPPGEKVNFASLKRAASLLQAGEDIDYEGVSGPVDFDAAGDVMGGTYAIWGVREGAIAVLSERSLSD